MSHREIGRHAAVLQLIAERLRERDLSAQDASLEECSLAIESVAAALICDDAGRTHAHR